MRGATEGLNLVAYAWGLVQPRPGRRRRRHRARAPLELRALAVHRRSGPAPTFRMIPIDDNGELDLAELDEIAAEGNVKVVAHNLVSNSLGTVNPIEKLAAWAHEHGAIMVVDGAQAAPHTRGRRSGARLRLPRVLVAQALRADERRRALGPARAARGDGAVQPRRAHDPLGRARGDDLGRGAVRSSRPGTQPIAEAVGFGAAIDYVNGGRARGDRAARARAHRVRARAARARSRTSSSTGRRRSGARGSSRSTSETSTRTTWRRCSTWRASRSGRATTAASR